MKRFLCVLTVAALVLPAVAAQAKRVKEYDFESAAQKHCPKDVVVWSNVRGGGIFHARGSKLYGKTTDGGYLCRKEAEAAGWHEYEGDKPQR